jgi:hypothetical protein
MCFHGSNPVQLCIVQADAHGVGVYFEKKVTMFWNLIWVSVNKFLNLQDSSHLILHLFEPALFVVEHKVPE